MNVGDQVIVTPAPDSLFVNEFIGTIHSIPEPNVYTIRDQDDDLFDAHPDQLEPLDDQPDCTRPTSPPQENQP